MSDQTAVTTIGNWSVPLSEEDLATLREEHTWIERHDCGAISVPMVVPHSERRQVWMEQRCTLMSEHTGDHIDQVHCYQFSVHHFVEGQVHHYNPRDFSGCSCGRSFCPVPALLAHLPLATAEAYDQGYLEAQMNFSTEF